MDETTVKTKVCSACKQELPLTDFYKNAALKDGYSHYCKACVKEKNRKKNEVHGLVKVYTNPELAKFQPRDLMAELKARGYTWEYMLEPQKKIFYTKI